MLYNNRLKYLREEKELNQYYFSDLLKLNREVYGQYEREYAIMPLKHLITICNFYNVSLDYLFEFTNVKQYRKVNKNIDFKFAGNRLKEWRKENKITQVEIAQLLKTDKSVICKYEKGRTLIATLFLYKICVEYGVSADYLLGRIDAPKYLK